MRRLLPIRMERPAAVNLIHKATAAAQTVLDKTKASIVAQVRKSDKFAKAKKKPDQDIDPDDDDDDSGTTADDMVEEFDLIELSGMGDEFAALLAEMGEDAAGELLGQVGVTEEGIVDQVNDRAVAAANDQAAELVSQITEATRDMLRRTISDALKENVGTDALIQRIQDSTAFSEKRSALIAHTEVRDANERGVLEGLRGARSAGVSLKKEWLLGPNPCPICQDNADEGPIDLDDDFPSGDDAPTAHPNCECALTGVVDGEESADEGDDDDGYSYEGEEEPAEGYQGFAKASDTIDQGKAGYLDQSPSDKVCGCCTMYRSKAGKFLGECTYVQGSISPRGWCKFFKAKKGK